MMHLVTDMSVICKALISIKVESSTIGVEVCEHYSR